MSCDPYLSLVIPAYNEEGRIWDTLGKVTRYLKTRPFSWEVVVVDDGSTDTTANLVRDYIKDNPDVHLISVPHGGKGWAVKHGMLQSQGTFRFLCDTDLSMPIEYLAQALVPMALVTLGFQLAKTKVGNDLSAGIASVICRLVISPVIGFIVVLLLDIQMPLAAILIVSTSFPTAINTVLIAMELKNKPEFAASAVFLTTLFSVITVAVTIYIVRFNGG